MDALWAFMPAGDDVTVCRKYREGDSNAASRASARLKLGFRFCLLHPVLMLGMVLVLTVLSAGQTSPPATTFKSNAELVLVPAYVTRNHQAVRNLTSSDFVLLHDGKPENLSAFEEVDEDETRTEEIPIAAQAARNYRFASSHKSATIVVLDFLDMTPLGWDRVHKNFPDVVRVLIEKQTPVEVLALSWNGLIEIMPLSGNPEDLLQAAERWKEMKNIQVPHDGSPVEGTRGVDGITRLLQVYGVTPDHAPSDVIDKATQEFDKKSMVFAAIEEIAQAYRGLPGRKKLVWITSKIPAYLTETTPKAWGDQISPQEMAALKVLTDANVAIYPVIANQVNATSGSRIGGGINWDNCTTSEPDFYLAYETGGGVCDDAPQDCVKRVIDDAKHYYLLGFYLHGKPKQGWHKLKVKVTRPKLDVRAKQAFIVGFQPGQNGILETKQQFTEAALKSPLNYTALPLSLNWRAVGTDELNRKLDLLIRSLPGVIAGDGNPNTLRLQVVVYLVPETQRVPQSFEEVISRELNPEQEKQLIDRGFEYRKSLTLAPDRYELKVLVRDEVTNRTGTISAKLDLTGSHP